MLKKGLRDTEEKKLKRSLFGDDYDDEEAPLEGIVEEEEQGGEEEDADIIGEMAFIMDEEEVDDNGSPVRNHRKPRKKARQAPGAFSLALQEARELLAKVEEEEDADIIREMAFIMDEEEVDENGASVRNHHKPKKMARQAPGAYSLALQEARELFAKVKELLDARNQRHGLNDYKETRLDDKVAPFVLYEKYMTEKDDKIRELNIPERMQAIVDSGERNWLDLPRDVVFTIFRKLGAIEVLTNAQRVCSVWCNISKDPFLWRTIDIHISEVRNDMKFDEIGRILCRRAVDYSCGNLLDISIVYFANDDLLHYIADSASHLRRLRLAYCYGLTNEGLSQVVKKLPQLEELDISVGKSNWLSKKSLEAIGRFCPKLKSVKFNKEVYIFLSELSRRSNIFPVYECDDEALAIAETMPEIRHIQLIGNRLTNDGLVAILDGCPHLESLDLRCCFNLNLVGSLGRRCAETVKVLRLPYDSIDDHPFEDEIIYVPVVVLRSDDESDSE